MRLRKIRVDPYLAKKDRGGQSKKLLLQIYI